MNQMPSSQESSSIKSWIEIGLRGLSRMDRVAMGILRVALVIVLVWIGGLKFVDYEADSIVPLVAQSPVMRFLYHHPDEYRTRVNREGELNLQHRAWHRENGTYSFSHGLGLVIISIAILIALYPIKIELSAIGSFLLIVMSCTTLSFLVTTPETWVPALGDANHGFPYLSGSGRLIVKDLIMLAAAFVTLVDSAKGVLRRQFKEV